MPATWDQATPDLIETANTLIASHHQCLKDVRIVFMFRSEPAVSNGKTAYANAQKVSPQMRALLDDADFIIWVSYPDWQNKMHPWRVALLDHQLHHCGVDDTGEETKYYIRPHDIEEFHAVIQRHGAYTFDILHAGAAIETAAHNRLMQLALEIETEVTKPARGATYTIDASRLNQIRMD